jgi:flagellar motor switch protein FliN/FliY
MRIGTIGDVRVRAQVVLGGVDLSVDELAAMGIGSIIELASIAGEPIDFVVSGEAVAKGEVVVIDEHFGIRITELAAETTRAGNER